MRPWVYMPCLLYSFKERAEAAEAAIDRAEKADMLLVECRSHGKQRFTDLHSIPANTAKRCRKTAYKAIFRL